jgi:altronate hydrolase
MVHHPNAGGVLVVSLGCENNQLGPFMEKVGPVDPARVRTLEVQKVQGDETEAGLELLRGIFAACKGDRRTSVPASKLRIGLKCGGSDGLSGITANPLLGVLSDRIAACGGTTVLTEVPEMFGAETILMNRCKDEATFEKTVKLINDFKQYFMDHHQTIYENPSPGNKKGGISTLEDKSCGCTQKAGTAPVCGVLQYAEPVKEKGLNLLSAPGNDLVAATATAVSGAHMVLFTTGRGTPFATLVPTMKISSNSKIAGYKKNWIDFNAGRMVEDMTKEQVAQALFDYVLKVASGEKVKSEAAGFHDIAIFKQGVTL